MSSIAQSELVIAYWFRTTTNRNISIVNILKIILEFCSFEAFISKNRNLVIENEGNSVRKRIKSWTATNVYGIVVAIPGNIYHWKLKVSHTTDKEINIGIVEEAKSKSAGRKIAWYLEEWGHSYYAASGEVWNAGKGKYYGSEYGYDDIIEIWLDLKNKYELSFCKNTEKYGKAADMKKGTEYRMAIDLYGDQKEIRLIDFRVNDTKF